MAGGRPTKYKKEYARTLPDMFKDGSSITQVSAKMGIHKDTFYEWAKTYPEFSDALKKGIALSQAWWETVGQKLMVNLSETTYSDDGQPIKKSTKSLNAAIWIFNMKNRFKDDWRDRQEIEHTSIEVPKVNVILEGVDNESASTTETS